MMRVSASVHVGIPDDARRLVWDVFFDQAKRGVSFRAHLPWSDASDTRAAVLRDAFGAAVAAAVIRPAPQDGVAMIGFVCVDARARGQGHARTLIAVANSALDAAGCHAALLWTAKPALYTQNGYEVISQEAFLSITRTIAAPFAKLPVKTDSWPLHGCTAALPAFALSGTSYRSDHAEAVVVRGANSLTLLDWRGALADVVALLDATGVGSWSVNVPSACPFIAVLDPEQFKIVRHKGAMTMARLADSSFAVDYVPVAARI
jgi:GNAT superfamily N-acetyltransferase